MVGLAESRVREALAGLASQTRSPAAGVAAALAAASAAALVELTSGLAADRIAVEGPDGEGAGGGRDDAENRLRALAGRAAELRARLLATADDDAIAYAGVIEAPLGAARARALSRACEPPLAIAEGAAEIAEAAAQTAKAGAWAFRADAVVAVELAAAAARCAAELVRANLAGREGDARLTRAGAASERAETAREAVA